MNNLGGFLDKFKNLIGNAKFQKGAILSIIKSASGIELSDKDIDVKNFILYIKGSPALKGEIFMRKQKILAELKNALGNKAPVDIK